MPSSKSSRSSKASRPSLLSLPSVTDIFSTVSRDRDSPAKSPGYPSVKRSDTIGTLNSPESGLKPQRRKSKLNVLTSFFVHNSPSGATTTLSAGSDTLRPKTAHEALQFSQLREKPVVRKAVASTVDLNTHSSVEDSPNSSSNPNGSISTVDNSSGIAGLGVATPDSDFDFGFPRTESPEHADAAGQGKPAVDMPTLQKHQRDSSHDVPPTPSYAPPLPPKVPERDAPSIVPIPETPTSNPPRSRGSERRSSSAHISSPEKSNGPAKLQSTRRPSSPAVPRLRSSSAHPPSSRHSTFEGSRQGSATLDPRPGSKNSSDAEGRGRLRRSWMPGSGRSRSASKDLKKMSPNKAWIMSPENQAEYNTFFLTNNEKVPELWNENGNVLVFLSPKSSGKGPSFKIPAQSVEASIVFHELIQGERESEMRGRDRTTSFSGRDNLMVEDATRLPEVYGLPTATEVRLYIPPPGPNSDASHDDSEQGRLQRLIAIRNLFAFLTGQPLVGTKAHPTTFAAFLQISSLLKEFDFMSIDGTTWGEAVDMSFGFYMSQMALADVRYSREKTLEAVILGERMKCWELYNEAYTHAVGKWQAILSLKSPLIRQMSPEVYRRLERANLDLLNRQHNVNQRLEEFEFPALFAGVAGSSEFKDVRFGRWKTAFGKMRNFTLDYYKSLFGSWPPKARSKKNPFSESGLNRLVLKALYGDLCALYDLLVDRDSITPRVIDQALEEVSDKEADQNIKALRKMLTEFDQSSPPVLPPIPFDIPKLPTMKSVQAKYDEMKEKERAKFDRSIKEYQLQLVMHKSYNFDTDNASISFLEQFKDFDFEQAKGKNTAELTDHRLGVWIFLYVVIQSLPLLVIDAPELQFTEGVEYFLCQPPMGNAPWIEDAGEVRKAWYQIPGSSVKVELSADVVMYSVEGTFERSHCWEVAKIWEEAKMLGNSTDMLGLPMPGGLGQPDNPLSPLEAPRAVFEDMDPIGYSSNPGSPATANSSPASPAPAPPRRVISPGSALAQGRGSGSAFRSSFAGVVGLEPLPGPMGTPVDRRSSRVYSAQSNARSDSLGRPSSSSGAPTGSLRSARSHGNLRSESPGTPVSSNNSHNRAGSSTFDDILKDMSNQDKKAKPAKKKFGF